MISRKAPQGMVDAANSGQWVGGPAPFGFVRQPVTINGKMRAGPLALGDAADVKRVRSAFAAYADGATLGVVAEIIGREWNASSARHMLANPAYIGVVIWGRRKGSTHHGVKENAHPRIIDPKLWALVQARLVSPDKRYAHGARRPAAADALPYALSGLLTCTCGADRPLVGGGGVPLNIPESQRSRFRTYQCKNPNCRGRVRHGGLGAHGVRGCC